MLLLFETIFCGVFYLMLSTTIGKSVTRQLDKWVLYSMNRRVPDSLEKSYHHTPTFETILQATTVNRAKTAEYSLSAPGEHDIWLNTPGGELLCHARVRPAVDPQAPLLLYHHGFNEVPYTNSWRRLFSDTLPTSAHCVCVQAPFHSNWLEPMTRGFASLQSVYQIFAGSLRIMELLQSHFERQGAAYTVLAGVSWGGITSVLYQGVFHQARAVVPMLSSPNLAQVMWDIAELFNRPLSVSRPELQELLDFTPYYECCNAERIFPLLAENDLFFRMEKHSAVFDEETLVTIPESHISAFWRVEALRQHVGDVLAWAESQASSSILTNCLS